MNNKIYIKTQIIINRIELKCDKIGKSMNRNENSNENELTIWFYQQMKNDFFGGWLCFNNELMVNK